MPQPPPGEPLIAPGSWELLATPRARRRLVRAGAPGELLAAPGELLAAPGELLAAPGYSWLLLGSS